MSHIRLKAVCSKVDRVCVIVSAQILLSTEFTLSDQSLPSRSSDPAQRYVSNDSTLKVKTGELVD